MRDLNGKARFFPRAFASIYGLKWSYQIDHYQAVGGDDYKNPNKTVTDKYSEARDVFLAGNWDAMFCCESDTIIPVDALEKLAALDVPIAYGLYVLRHGKREWNAALDVKERSWTSYSEMPDMARDVWGKTILTKGIGQGCTLIQRDVMEAIPFRYIKGVSCDWGLALDADAAGFEQVVDFSVICGHMTLTPSPQTYWPDPNEEKLYRVEFPV